MSYFSSPSRLHSRLLKRNVPETPNGVDADGVAIARRGCVALVNIKAGGSVPDVSVIALTPTKPVIREKLTAYVMIDVTSSLHF